MTEPYLSFEEIYKNPPVGDCYISGSDQVWNMKIAHEAFFLGFGDETVRKISYAASIGIYDLDEQELQKLGDNLKNFDVVSVREKKSKEFIQSNFGRDSQVHIDPVFLLNQEKWLSIAKECKIGGDYILCYILSENELLNISIKKLKIETNYKIVIVTPNPTLKAKADIVMRDIGPCEFLYLIYNSKLILSTSFHGVAMSIVLQKDFYAYVGNHAPYRITGLLELLGLEDRLIKKLQQVSLEPINYASIMNRIEKQVESAKRYLQNNVIKKN